MNDLQLLGGVLLTLAVLGAAAITLTAVILVAASAARPGPAPHGVIRPDRSPHPEPGQAPDGWIWPDQAPDPQPDPDDARVLVLR